MELADTQAGRQADRQTDMTRSETKSLFWSDRLFRVHVVLIAQFRLRTDSGHDARIMTFIVDGIV